MMRKIQKVQIKVIYYSLVWCGLFSEEQKDDHSWQRGTDNLLYIDQQILLERKPMQKNIAMAWIDNKKAHDIVPLSWMVFCLKMYKIPKKLLKCMTESMKYWKVAFTEEGKSLEGRKILAFVIEKMLLNYILKKCVMSNKFTK